MAVLRRAESVSDGRQITVLAPDIWTNQYASTEIINIGGSGVVNIYGDVIAGHQNLGSHVAISSYNNDALDYARINIFAGAQVLNTDPYGYSIYFIGNGLISNAGTIQELFLMGMNSGVAKIKNTGLVYSERSYAVGTNTQGSAVIENQGEIRGNGFGVAVLAREYGDGETTIINSGKISGSEAGIKVFFDMRARADVEITNSGTIEGAKWSIVSETHTTEVVRNSGRLIGKVDLGGGHDTFDNRGGWVKGDIHLGAGNDIAVPGASIETYYGGGGVDTLDFRSGGALVVSLATGTGTGRADGDRYIGFERILGSDTGSDSLIGDSLANTLEGFGGNDSLVGGAGNDTLIGGNGNDRLDGGVGNDLLLGEAGNDMIYGGEGHNNVNAGAGIDIVRTGAGSDTINAGDGADNVNSGAGGDRIFGLQGNDTIDTGDGHDIVIGGAGNDLLRGGAGNDDLAAEAGQDTLDGGAGNDMLRGGSGADLFIFNDGQDTIRNFDSSQDRIDLRSFAGLDRWADVSGHLRQEGGHVVFRHGDDVLRVDWVQLTSLGADDFVW